MCFNFVSLLETPKQSILHLKHYISFIIFGLHHILALQSPKVWKIYNFILKNHATSTRPSKDACIIRMIVCTNYVSKNHHKSKYKSSLFVPNVFHYCYSIFVLVIQNTKLFSKWIIMSDFFFGYNLYFLHLCIFNALQMKITNNKMLPNP